MKYSKYTHQDSSGMAWRFEGSRPVSALADIVMQQVKEEKARNKARKKKEMKTAIILKGLEELQLDIETGAIQNPSAAADRRNERHNKFIKKLIEAIQKQELINNVLGES